MKKQSKKADNPQKSKKLTVDLVLVSSLNGRLTNADEPSYLWASAEDQVWFEDFKQRHQAIVMGSQTYLSARQQINLSPLLLRVVMSSEPKRYEAEQVLGQLEFSQLSPALVLEMLQQRGFDSIMVAGGGQLAAAFLRAGLITDLYLTLEPLYVAGGVSWADELEKYSLALQLVTVTRLNDRGTLLLHYRLC